jgi:multidrug efflux pump subunit AcrA (membrane-fusion protein)
MYMKKFLRFVHSWKFYALIIVIALSVFSYIRYEARNNVAPITTTAEVGTVQQIVSVSGSIKAVQTAELTFPVPGILESVGVKNGDHVLYGHTLATLVHHDLKASYQDAYGALLIAQADKTELLTGIRPEERDVTKTKVAIAEDTFAQTILEHDERVVSAYRTLLSSSLTAKPEDNDNDDTAPTITGTYTCEAGTYTLDMFRSGAKSGYSYRLSGLENGTYTAYTESSAPMGRCGLHAQFTEGDSYGTSIYTITIPNTESSAYVTNKNAYELAKTNRENAVRAAEQTLELARQNEILDTAAPRTEAVNREDARVTQAEARMGQIQAQIDDHILTAPFDGTITSISPTVGEAVGTEPVITMVADNTFELTALIPEIDVTKVIVGQKAHVVFDARSSESLIATVVFLSPLAKVIEGVSYFEATLLLDTEVEWLRGGLNADVDIIIAEHTDALRIPTRFLITEGDAHAVLVQKGETQEKVPVIVSLFGNDGYVHIDGIEPGTVVIAP